MQPHKLWLTHPVQKGDNAPGYSSFFALAYIQPQLVLSPGSQALDHDFLLENTHPWVNERLTQCVVFRRFRAYCVTFRPSIWLTPSKRGSLQTRLQAASLESTNGKSAWLEDDPLVRRTNASNRPEDRAAIHSARMPSFASRTGGVPGKAQRRRPGRPDALADRSPAARRARSGSWWDRKQKSLRLGPASKPL